MDALDSSPMKLETSPQRDTFADTFHAEHRRVGSGLNSSDLKSDRNDLY